MTISIRVSPAEEEEFNHTATLSGKTVGGLSALLVREGFRRTRFPAIDFREGQPGRVAYLAGSRWPVWLLIELTEEYNGKLESVASHIKKPAALVRMVLDYAAAYPEEITAARKLAQSRSR